MAFETHPRQAEPEIERGAAAGGAVHTRGLTKRFGDFTAVSEISFDVQRGEIFGLLGPNGAGKSTTFRMLCAALVRSRGSGSDTWRSSSPSTASFR